VAFAPLKTEKLDEEARTNVILSSVVTSTTQHSGLCDKL